MKLVRTFRKTRPADPDAVGGDPQELVIAACPEARACPRPRCRPGAPPAGGRRSAQVPAVMTIRSPSTASRSAPAIVATGPAARTMMVCCAESVEVAASSPAATAADAEPGHERLSATVTRRPAPAPSRAARHRPPRRGCRRSRPRDRDDAAAHRSVERSAPHELQFSGADEGIGREIVVRPGRMHGARRHTPGGEEGRQAPDVVEDEHLAGPGHEFRRVARVDDGHVTVRALVAAVHDRPRRRCRTGQQPRRAPRRREADDHASMLPRQSASRPPAARPYARRTGPPATRGPR